jgi:hypothetical protein
MQKEKLLGLFKSGIDASLGSFIDISPSKTNDDHVVKEETLLKIERLRSLAPAKITEDLANIATALCNNVYNASNRKNVHVHLVMMIDSIFDLAEYWENTSSGAHNKDPVQLDRMDPSSVSNSLNLANIYGDSSDVVYEGSYNAVVQGTQGNNDNNGAPKKLRAQSLSFVTGELAINLSAAQPTPHHRLEDPEVQWKDHDQLELEELQEKIQRLERQVKLDSESLVKAKMKCMNYELLCEENQRLQRTILELEYKLQQQKENAQLELQFSKLEMKSLHQRILEITSELQETKKTFEDTNIVTSHQKEDNTQMKQHNDQLELNNSVLEDQVKTLFEEKENLRRTITTLEEELHATHLSKSEMEIEITTLQKLLLSKEKQEAMLMSTLQQRAIVDAQYKQMEMNQAHQLKVIEDLKSTIRGKEKECLTLVQRVDMSERQITVLETELNATRDSCQENQLLAQSLTSRIAVLEQDLETLHHEKEDLLLEMESIRNDLALERMNSQILKDELLNISKDKLRLQQEVSALERDLDDIQRQVEYEHEQNQALRSGQGQQSTKTSNASARAAAVINMLKLGASAVSGSALGGISESSMIDSPESMSHVNENNQGSHGGFPAAAPSPAVDQFIHNNEATPKSVNTVPETPSVPTLDSRSTSPVPPRADLIDRVSILPPSPTPALVYNGPPSVDNSNAGKSGRFKFSLPSAPQLSINKLQLPSSLGGRSSLSPSVPGQSNTSSNPEPKKGSDGFPSALSASSRLLSFGKKKTTVGIEPEPVGPKSDPIPEAVDIAQNVDEYDSYEDNDSDSDEKEDDKPYRSAEHKKKVFADYSYD